MYESSTSTPPSSPGRTTIRSSAEAVSSPVPEPAMSVPRPVAIGTVRPSAVRWE
jgi:hypothetical protein